MAKECPLCHYRMTPMYRYVRKGTQLIRELYRWVCTHCSYQCNA